ncbi:autophagy-related protein 2 homolog B isoform X2 [Eupeodes corollae]|uniref:autophagy-related protein 2 homolog B isoform X2 n=1 Tax=Eupeodes corollae TaxID=290404 RepID=UPI0024905B62|nr:autophagy-related protein 2 homolog B isoform X2 [Eupeodes corollae]
MVPWFNVFDGLKNKTCRYLLQRYLGQFLEEKLNLEQLNVELYNGKATVRDVALNCKSLNELCETQGWGVEVTGGHIGLITVQVPWNAIMTNDSSIEVSDLFISLRPVQRQTDGSSMLESMWSSVSSSMQLAQECLEKHGTGEEDFEFNAQNNSIEGLEKFAQTIDSVLNRIKAKCLNTEIRLEYLPPKSSQGIAIVIKIQNLNYRNEAGSGGNGSSGGEEGHNTQADLQSREEIDGEDGSQHIQLLSTFATHNINMEGITIYTEEFRVSQPNNSNPLVEPSLDESRTRTPRSNLDLEASVDDPFYSMISTTTSSIADQHPYTGSFKRTQESAMAASRSSSSSSFSRRSRTPTASTADDEEDTDAEEDDTEQPLVEVYSSKCIPIVRMDGKQEIKIKMKQTEDVAGPKVSLDVQLGALYVFSTPRQLHLVTNFCDAFFAEDPAVGKETPSAGRTDPSQPQMSGGLGANKNFSSNMTGILGGQGNWGEPAEDFSYRATTSSKRAPSMFSNDDGRSTLGSDYCESVSSSLSSSTTTTCSSKFARKAANLEASGDISNFNITIASAAVVVLHEDILVACSSSTEMPGSPLSVESELNLLKLSNYFFSCIDEKQGLVGFTCQKNHLKMYAAPIIAEGIQQRNKNLISMKFTISMTRVDLHEVLENVATPLLEFERTQMCDEEIHKRPEMIIQMKTTTPSLNPQSRKRKVPIPPRTEFDISLDKCTVELDISIYDRLSAIFCSSPFSADTPPIEEIKKNESRHLDPIKEFNVTSPIMQLRLRFPIADSRPVHDPNRVPWWKQNVRPDLLLLSFYQIRMKFSSLLIEFLANEIDVYYVESHTIPKIHLFKSNLVNNSIPTLKEPNVDYPRISIEFPSEKTLSTLLKCCTEDSDSAETSGESCDLYTRRSREYVPFSSKRVCRQSDTPHPNINKECETILLPGDSQEMRKFCDTAMKTSKLQIKISLPTALIQVSSKQLYEIIYNRVNTDLLMWEPSSPSFIRKAKPPPAPTIEQSLLNIGMMDSMYVPSTSPLHPYDTYDNDAIPTPKHYSSSEDDCGGGGGVGGGGGGGCDHDSGGPSDNESDSIYYSTYEKKRSKRSLATQAAMKTSGCSFELSVGKGVLSLFPPVRDAENRVLPNQLGEFRIAVEDFCIFSVSRFNGNDNMAYLCLHTKDLQMFHCGLIPTRDSEPGLPEFKCIPHHMQSTFYSSPANLTKSDNEGNVNREMLSLAIEIKKVPDQSLKRLKITTGIQKATLRHNPALSQHTWLNQLIDFLDVIDYPIEGYKPYGIVTEIQVHLWDCAIDYRPKNFPFRSVIEIGSFMMSSNIVSSVPGCTLRFIAEECILSLAPYEPKSSKSENKVTALPSSNLVPVIDIGLLDISLRLNEKASERSPKLDLRTSIQDVHIRSCFDSGRALATLIAYVASDGDLLNVGDDDESMTSSMESSVYSDASLFSMKDRKSSIPEISARQQERVNLMMAEAVQETVSSRAALDEDAEHRFDRGVEVFFFPDESNQGALEKNSASTSSPGVDKKLDVPVSSSSGEQIKVSPVPGLSRTNSSSDEWAYQAIRHSGSSNELQDLLNFETSVMKNSYINQEDDDDAVEALPQVREELGDVKQTEKIPPVMKSSMGLDDDFCVIADEEKSYLSQCGIRDLVISEDPLRMVDNHFKLPAGKPDLLQAPENFPMAEYRYTLCEMTLTWHLYGGHDFPLQSTEVSSTTEAKDKEKIRPEPQPSMSDAFKHGVSYSKVTESIQYGKKPKEKLSWRTIGGTNRNHETLVEIQLSKVRCSHEVYPTQTTQASRQVLVISELEVRDRLQTSEINKFLYHPSAKHLPNKSSQHMIVIKALHVRPHPSTSISEECSLRISLLPLRLNIDQDTLLFIAQFFNDLSSSGDVGSDGEVSSTSRRQSSLQPPVMMVDDLPEAVQDYQARKMVSTNLDLLMEGEEKSHRKELPTAAAAAGSTANAAETGGKKAPIYFREVIFSPEVNIRLDYHGRRIELSRGPIVGFLMGLGQLQCSEIKLKKIIYKHGLLGIDKLIAHLCKEWLQDIKKNQVPAILSGVGPTYAFVQLFQGVYDLFWLPFEQYQKDGRFVRGLQLGAQSFTARTALAALEITSRVIQLLQFTAETAYDMVSPGPSVRSIRHNRKGKRRRPHRPQDIREGVVNAYQIVRDGINDTANALIETAVLEHDQKGYTGAVGGIIRQIPQLVVQPAVLATQATTNILGGVKSSLVPDAKLEARQKWKEDSD